VNCLAEGAVNQRRLLKIEIQIVLSDELIFPEFLLRIDRHMVQVQLHTPGAGDDVVIDEVNDDAFTFVSSVLLDRALH
jgi:hypothetical protein